MFRAMRVAAAVALVGGLAMLEGAPSDGPSPQAPPPRGPSLHVGLRRSSYGLPRRNAADAWWVARAKSYAARFGAQPTIVQIVSTYQEDGSTNFEFARPDRLEGDTAGMSFHAGTLDHLRALGVYDGAGVKAIIQLESGNADVMRCLEVAHQVLGHHPCVIGYGIDAEWYFHREAPGRDGRPIAAAAARAWLEKTLSFNKDYIFFIKHYSTKNIPEMIYHPQLLLLDDSQDFESEKLLMADFTLWASKAASTSVGFQIGYPKDRRWWSALKDPPATLGTDILVKIPSCKYLFWVDFTADQVEFK